jgi:ribosome-associated translation inhibitor RaiA
MVANEINSKIILEKFDCLDADELVIAKKLIQKYVQKIEKIVDYDKMKLEIKVHPKNNLRHFEIKGHLEYKENRAMSESQDSNPFVALDIVLENILKEIKHKTRKN